MCCGSVPAHYILFKIDLHDLKLVCAILGLRDRRAAPSRRTCRVLPEMELGGYHHPGAVQNESFTSQRGVVRILLYAPPEAVLNPCRHGEVIMIPHGTMLLGD